MVDQKRFQLLLPECKSGVLALTLPAQKSAGWDLNPYLMGHNHPCYINTTLTWSQGQELNLQPTDYKSVALPLSYTGMGAGGGVEPPTSRL